MLKVDKDYPGLCAPSTWGDEAYSMNEKKPNPSFSEFLEEKYNPLVKEELCHLMRDLWNRRFSYEKHDVLEKYTPRDSATDSKIYRILALVHDYMEMENL